jgi:TetR/AcrR family transcriptional regulator, transcriptional repressor of bet genes
MARRKDPALEQRRRLLILTTVRRLLVEGSHATVTLDRVAAEAGVSKGMVTYYFGSKERLITETIAHYLHEQEAMLGAIARAEGSFRERLERLLEAALPSRRALEAELRLQGEVLSFAKESAQTLEAVRRLYRGFRRACEALVEVGIRDGSLAANQARGSYLLVHALVDGLSLQLALDPELDVADMRARAVATIERILQAPAAPGRRRPASSRRAR